MGLYLNQKDERSELQQRLAAELQERAKKRAVGESQTDNVTDSHFLENTKRTTSLVWIWILIVIALVAISVWLITILK